MRDGWASSELIRSSQGMARGTQGSMMASRAMRLKLSGQLSMEVSERRQVGDAEEMFAEKGVGAPWWRNVGMEEDM
ncbi:hypothetical protein CC80DRAFT_461575 [Byssothecium circinans]|uniref:Uncharacterized protein n=1 Tax=Byssothecium circinans TaxID=147558 RepID=A0A6A5UPQ4_9PLEO|nr:hypothetical protein CC80DRAFT_461575 [Byssothecium circinans]